MTRHLSGSTRQGIIDAAAVVLERQGCAGLRIHEVAEVANVRPSAIYHYFASREDLIAEVVEKGIAQLTDDVREAVERADTDRPEAVDDLSRFLIAIEAHLRCQWDGSLLTRAAIHNLGQLPPSLRDLHLLGGTTYRAIWLDLIARANAIDSGLDHQVVATLVLGALNWTAEWWNGDRGALDDLISNVQIIVRHGLSHIDRPQPTTPSEMTTPTRVETGGTRERILEAAAEVLSQRGYAETHLSDITGSIGLTPPAVYHHFRSRDTLVQAVVREGTRRVRLNVVAALNGLPLDASPRERVATAVAAHIRVVLDETPFVLAAQRNLGHLPPRIARACKTEVDTFHEVWRGLLADAAAAGHLREGLESHVARLLIAGALNATLLLRPRDVPVDLVVRTTQRLVDRGLFRH